MDDVAVASSLAERLAAVTFRDVPADEVTALLIDEVVAWGAERGWRVYRRAASVVRLPPPLERRHSVVDVAIARPVGPPVVVEVDHTDRRRTLDKLVAEAGAGRVAVWVRWGAGPFAAPPPGVHLVTCEVTRHAGPAGGGRVYSRGPGADRPPPAHSAGAAAGDAIELPFGDAP
jgi:hypothetical protein